MIKAVLFDKDGVLFDFQKTWGAWAADLLKGLAEGDAALYRALGARVGFDPETEHFDPDSPVIAGTPEEGVQLLLPLLPAWGFDALLAHSNETAAAAPLVETVPLTRLMAELRGRGLSLGVATNDAERSARAHLRAAGVEESFDMIMGFDSGFGAKPAPGMTLAFAQAVGLDPAQIAMIGDSSHDMEAARAAGMRRIAVLTGPASRAALEPHADAVLPSIADLPEYLSGL